MEDRVYYICNYSTVQYYGGYGIVDGASVAKWVDDRHNARTFSSAESARAAVDFIERVIHYRGKLVVRSVERDAF